MSKFHTHAFTQAHAYHAYPYLLARLPDIFKFPRHTRAESTHAEGSFHSRTSQLTHRRTDSQTYRHTLEASPWPERQPLPAFSLSLISVLRQHFGTTAANSNTKPAPEPSSSVELSDRVDALRQGHQLGQGHRLRGHQPQKGCGSEAPQPVRRQEREPRQQRAWLTSLVRHRARATSARQQAVSCTSRTSPRQGFAALRTASPLTSWDMSRQAPSMRFGPSAGPQ